MLTYIGPKMIESSAHDYILLAYGSNGLVNFLSEQTAGEVQLTVTIWFNNDNQITTINLISLLIY